MLRQQEQRRVGDVAQMEMRGDTQNDSDFIGELEHVV